MDLVQNRARTTQKPRHETCTHDTIRGFEYLAISLEIRGIQALEKSRNCQILTIDFGYSRKVGVAAWPRPTAYQGPVDGNRPHALGRIQINTTYMGGFDRTLVVWCHGHSMGPSACTAQKKMPTVREGSRRESLRGRGGIGGNVTVSTAALSHDGFASFSTNSSMSGLPKRTSP